MIKIEHEFKRSEMEPIRSLFTFRWNQYELYTQKAWTSTTLPCGEVHWRDGSTGTTEVLTIGEVIYATVPEFNFSFHRGRIKKVVRTHGYTIHFDNGSVQEIVQRENIRVVFDMFENKWELDFQMPLTRTRVRD